MIKGTFWRCMLSFISMILQFSREIIVRSGSASQHLSRGVLSHISYFGWVVGVAWVGGCGSGWVADHNTPSVIPFWNRLIKCSLNPKRKV